jgi:hypothetical protein
MIMPIRRLHEQFDMYLAKKCVLLEDARYGEVHRFMDLGVREFGSKHQDEDKYHDADEGKCEALRTWINGKYNVIRQDRATDWLRAGLGHICLDKAKQRLPDSASKDELFDSAYRSMAQRSWDRAKFYSR